MKLWEMLLPLLKTQAEVLLALTEACEPSTLLAHLRKAHDGTNAPEGLMDLITSAPQNSGGRLNLLEELDALPKKLPINRELEPFLWDYQPYRLIVESQVDLESPLGSDWIDEITSLGKAWIQSLGEAVDLPADTLRSIEAPWIRFRSDCLRKIGLRSLR